MAALDTISGSFIHSVFRYRDPTGTGNVFELVRIYIVAVLFTIGPLFIAALFSPLSLTEASAVHKLPFLKDWNVLFMFFISFPSLLILTVTDQNILKRSLQSVYSDNTITFVEGSALKLCGRWQRRFRLTNWAAQAIGTCVGGLVAYFNYIACVPAAVGFWIADEGNLLPVGVFFLFCIFIFYVVVTVYVVRSIAMSVFLKDVVASSQLHLLPLHPDKSGGLRPIGHLGLRNQYVLSLLGLNLLLMAVIYSSVLSLTSYLGGLIAAAVCAYLFLGPIVFVAPLLPFRAGMLDSKNQLTGEIAKRLRLELDRIRTQIESGKISKEDEELIDRLRKIGAILDELPVWPFDTGTLRKFLTAYFIPIASTLAAPFLKVMFDVVKDRIS